MSGGGLSVSASATGELVAGSGTLYSAHLAAGADAATAVLRSGGAGGQILAKLTAAIGGRDERCYVLGVGFSGGLHATITGGGASSGLRDLAAAKGEETNMGSDEIRAELAGLTGTLDQLTQALGAAIAVGDVDQVEPIDGQIAAVERRQRALKAALPIAEQREAAEQRQHQHDEGMLWSGELHGLLADVLEGRAIIAEKAAALREAQAAHGRTIDRDRIEDLSIRIRDRRMAVPGLGAAEDERDPAALRREAARHRDLATAVLVGIDVSAVPRSDLAAPPVDPRGRQLHELRQKARWLVREIPRHRSFPDTEAKVAEFERDLATTETAIAALEAEMNDAGQSAPWPAPSVA